MPYVGRGLTTGAQYQKLDAIAINNATTFTMSVGSANVSPDQNHLILVVNGVIQEPGTGFTVSGSTCTLASAITTSGHSGTDTIYGVIAGDAAFAAYDSIGVNALGVTAGTVTASRAVVPDSNKDIASFRNVTLTGELDAATLDISGNADIDGTLEADAITVDGTALATYIRDTVGNNMVSSNTESGITVTYDTSNDNIDFAVDAAQTGITSLLATDIKIGEDDQTKIDFETADEIHFYAANAEQVYVADGVFGPQTDSDVDLGSNSVRWKDAYVDSVTSTGAISGTTGTFSGVVDADAGVTIDNITIDGTEIDLSSGDLTLDVAGDIYLDADGDNIKFQAAGTAKADLSWSSGGDVTFFTETSNADLYIKGNDGGSTITAMMFDMSEGGKVGIGTSSPKNYLHVSDGSTSNLSLSDGIIITDASNPKLVFEDTGEGTDDKVIMFNYYDEALRIMSSNDDQSSWNNANIAVFHRDGKVGIGTASPDTILDVRQSSDGGGAEIKIVNTAGSGSSDETVELTAQHTTSEYVGGKIQFFRSGDYSTTGQRQGGIKFYTCDDNTNELAMTMTKQKYIGIGEASPDARLEVSIDDGSTYAGHFKNSNGTAPTLWVEATGNDANDTAVVKVDVNSATRLVITNEDGNVGIGETGPSTVCHIKGRDDAHAGVGVLLLQTAYASGTTRVIQTFYDDGGAHCGEISIHRTNHTAAYGTSSDYRLKENETAISDGLTRLNQLKPYKFNFKSNVDKTKVDGFFAHEVSSIVPEAVVGEKDAMAVNPVTGEEEISKQQIDHSKLVPLLVAAVQELSAKVEALEGK